MDDKEILDRLNADMTVTHAVLLCLLRAHPQKAALETALHQQFALGQTSTAVLSLASPAFQEQARHTMTAMLTALQ